MRKFFKKTARITDSLFRGLCRGLAIKNFITFLGRFFHRDTNSAGLIASLPVTLVTTLTSYAGTRWWTLDMDDKAEVTFFLSSNRSFFFKSTRGIDAFLRGMARAEAVENSLIIIGQLTQSDLLTPACISALITLFLVTWTSYDRGAARSQLVQTTLPFYQECPSEADASSQEILNGHPPRYQSF